MLYKNQNTLGEDVCKELRCDELSLRLGEEDS